jgi:hypothetical protein
MFNRLLFHTRHHGSDQGGHSGRYAYTASTKHTLLHKNQETKLAEAPRHIYAGPWHIIIKSEVGSVCAGLSKVAFLVTTALRTDAAGLDEKREAPYKVKQQKSTKLWLWLTAVQLGRLTRSGQL